MSEQQQTSDGVDRHPSNTHAGRVAVVTGAAGGFGTAISVDLARRGADVVAVDVVDPSATIALVEAQGRRALGITADISTKEGVDAIRDDLFGLGRVDILVNNAGAFPFIDLWELTWEDFKRTQAINLDSQMLMIMAVMGHMRDNGWGRIVNLGSNSLGLSVPSMAHYMCAKGGVLGLTRALASDLGDHGITVNAVCPAPSKTPGGNKFIGDQIIGDVASQQAIKRPGVADDLVGVVAFLSSDDSAFMTGQTLVNDGGLWRV